MVVDKINQIWHPKPVNTFFCVVWLNSEEIFHTALIVITFYCACCHKQRGKQVQLPWLILLEAIALEVVWVIYQATSLIHLFQLLYCKTVCLTQFINFWPIGLRKLVLDFLTFRDWRINWKRISCSPKSHLFITQSARVPGGWIVKTHRHDS